MLVANDAFGEAVKEVYEPDWPGRDKLIQYLEVCNNYHKTSVFEKMGLSSSSKEITRSVSSDMQFKSGFAESCLDICLNIYYLYLYLLYFMVNLGIAQSMA